MHPILEIPVRACPIMFYRSVFGRNMVVPKIDEPCLAPRRDGASRDSAAPSCRRTSPNEALGWASCRDIHNCAQSSALATGVYLSRGTAGV